jgi:hypothetical protein
MLMTAELSKMLDDIVFALSARGEMGYKCVMSNLNQFYLVCIKKP